LIVNSIIRAIRYGIGGYRSSVDEVENIIRYDAVSIRNYRLHILATSILYINILLIIVMLYY